MKENKIIQLTRQWINDVVIRYSLCPFAKTSFDENMIGYWVQAGIDIELILRRLAECLIHISTSDAAIISNGFLILPDLSNDYQKLLDTYDYGCLLLDDMELSDALQMVPFHPDFQFEGEEKDDPSNLTNASPYAMIHILRIDEVSRAIDSHPDISSVPERNKDLLRKLTVTELQSIRELLGIYNS